MKDATNEQSQQIQRDLTGKLERKKNHGREIFYSNSKIYKQKSEALYDYRYARVFLIQPLSLERVKYLYMRGNFG